jgi:hypothetical protein
LVAGSQYDINILDHEIAANVQKVLPNKIPANMKIKTGGEYTVSFWMYISSWNDRAGSLKGVLEINDTKDTAYSLLTTALYPNEAKLMIRVHTEDDTASSMNNKATFKSAAQGTGIADLFNASLDLPACDIQGIDLQRWINITISVNGRIVDVYYDGKLARSVVLAKLPTAPTEGVQSFTTGMFAGYGGKISGIQYFPYPLTPDRIYAIYQAGPRGSAGFIGYLADKLGIRMTYSGASGTSQSINI